LSHIAGWCERILPDGGTFTAFTDWRMVPPLVPAIESSGMRYQSLIVWKKPNAGLGNGFKAQHELAMHFSKGTPNYYAKDGSNVIDSKRVNAAARNHQTEKPVDLIAEIIRIVSDKGHTILDPFAGSCTTGRAAKDLGRKAVLIEREERYCEIGARRMQQEVFDFGGA
jgi:DNA modification methylase